MIGSAVLKDLGAEKLTAICDGLSAFRSNAADLRTVVFLVVGGRFDCFDGVGGFWKPVGCLRAAGLEIRFLPLKSGTQSNEDHFLIPYFTSSDSGAPDIWTIGRRTMKT